MATLKDISKATGFSITTVSRALNNYDDVSEETKQKINSTAQKLKYSPNVVAQNLVMKTSKTIGLMVSSLKRENKNNLVFETLCGVYDTLEALDYEFILLSTSSAKQKNQTFEQICSQRQLAGVIIQGLKISDPYLEEARNSSIPCVLIDIPVSGEKMSFVTSNQKESIKNAIKYLHRLSHRQIAYVNGTKDAHVSTERKQGYEEALTAVGLDINPDYIIQGDFDEDITRKAITSFLINHPEVTAILCASDIMALGVLDAAKNLDIKVPEQVSVIGFDNILLTEYTTPTLTTIAQAPYEMATEAAKLLIDLIEEPDGEKMPKIIQNELLIRKSTSSITITK